MSSQKPSLFGLKSSNRDFTSKNSWGKNQFNSSFPASLCCYLDSIGRTACYIQTAADSLKISETSITNIFGIDPKDENTYFAFEATHSPFQKYVIGSLPRTDLVIQNKTTGACLAGLEVKLTALPDNTTYDLLNSDYGSEIVVRPDTIVYLACSIARALGTSIAEEIGDGINISNWSDAREVLPHVAKIVRSIRNISINIYSQQKPFLLQPVWKTEGKSPVLAENCLDVFCWSDGGFAYFISCIADSNPKATKITRQTRTAIWLYKMLLDLKSNGCFDHHKIIDELSYNTKNDKAFASAGNVTNKYMKCDRLTKPVISRTEIKNIIRGGGQHLLSPERRFDAIIYNTPGLFS
jgi:hypothetical protein